MSLIFHNLLNVVKYNAVNHLTNAIRTISIKSSTSSLPKTITSDKSDNKHKTDIFKNVNNLLKENTAGRLFAVIQLCGKQFKITSGDIILVEGYWPPTIGDKIRLDKVLLAGGKDFTLVGTPILKPSLVDVQATIIEKTLTHTRTNFIKRRRKQFMRIRFYRNSNTMIRINSIEVKGEVNNSSSSGSTQDKELRMF